ncbi:MAG: hypothetical protein OD811_05700, partial [Alphaproteobacteria bacterium]
MREIAAAQSGRGALFLPVGLGMGIACYFALRYETEGFTTALWPALLFLLLGLVLHRSFRGSLPSRTCFAFALILAGFLLADWQTEHHRAPRLDGERWGVDFSGRVVRAEPRASGARVVLDSLVIEDINGIENTPRFARITMRRETLPMPGTELSGRAVLRPPFAPR